MVNKTRRKTIKQKGGAIPTIEEIYNKRWPDETMPTLKQLNAYILYKFNEALLTVINERFNNLMTNPKIIDFLKDYIIDCLFESDTVITIKKIILYHTDSLSTSNYDNIQKLNNCLPINNVPKNKRSINDVFVFKQLKNPLIIEELNNSKDTVLLDGDIDQKFYNYKQAEEEYNDNKILLTLINNNTVDVDVIKEKIKKEVDSILAKASEYETIMEKNNRDLYFYYHRGEEYSYFINQKGSQLSEKCKKRYRAKRFISYFEPFICIKNQDYSVEMMINDFMINMVIESNVINERIKSKIGLVNRIKSWLIETSSNDDAIFINNLVDNLVDNKSYYISNKTKAKIAYMIGLLTEPKQNSEEDQIYNSVDNKVTYTCESPYTIDTVDTINSLEILISKESGVAINKIKTDEKMLFFNNDRIILVYILYKRLIDIFKPLFELMLQTNRTSEGCTTIINKFLLEIEVEQIVQKIYGFKAQLNDSPASILYNLIYFTNYETNTNLQLSINYIYRLIGHNNNWRSNDTSEFKYFKDVKDGTYCTTIKELFPTNVNDIIIENNSLTKIQAIKLIVVFLKQLVNKQLAKVIGICKEKKEKCNDALVEIKTPITLNTNIEHITSSKSAYFVKFIYDEGEGEDEDEGEGGSARRTRRQKGKKNKKLSHKKRKRLTHKHKKAYARNVSNV